MHIVHITQRKRIQIVTTTQRKDVRIDIILPWHLFTNHRQQQRKKVPKKEEGYQSKEATSSIICASHEVQY